MNTTLERLPDRIDVYKRQVLKSPKKMFWVQTGKGVIAVEELQLQGKKMMPASAFLLGNKVEGEILQGE